MAYLPIKEVPEFNSEIRKIESTDLAKPETFNPQYETLLNNDVYLEKELEKCFQSVSDGKNVVSSAITDKGVQTEATATSETMAENIRSIETDPSGDATATAEDIIAPATAYAQGQKLTGTLEKNGSGGYEEAVRVVMGTNPDPVNGDLGRAYFIIPKKAYVNVTDFDRLPVVIAQVDAMRAAGYALQSEADNWYAIAQSKLDGYYGNYIQPTYVPFYSYDQNTSFSVSVNFGFTPSIILISFAPATNINGTMPATVWAHNFALTQFGPISGISAGGQAMTYYMNYRAINVTSTGFDISVQQNTTNVGTTGVITAGTAITIKAIV